MNIYDYDPDTGEYLGSRVAQLDPLVTKEKGEAVFLVPANATIIAPPSFKKNQMAVFDGESWEIVPDFRKFECYDPITQETIELALGESPPVGFPTTRPEPYTFKVDEWDNKNQKWVEGLTDIELCQLSRREIYDPKGDQLDNITKAFKYMKANGVDIGPDGDAQVAMSDKVKSDFPLPSS